MQMPLYYEQIVQIKHRFLHTNKNVRKHFLNLILSSTHLLFLELGKDLLSFSRYTDRLILHHDKNTLVQASI